MSAARRMRLACGDASLRAVGALLLALAPAIGAAQIGQPAVSEPAALAAISAHVDAARFDSARAALATWQATHAATAREAERAAADMFAARLERDGVAAQHAWLGLALAHPFGSDAALALLRVGQAALLQGDTAAAFVYLHRLIDDFPGSGHEAEAHLWLSRAQIVARDRTAACQSARSGLAIAASAEVQGLLRLQQERACSAPSAAAAGAPAAPAAGIGHRFAVQAGAFRARTGADALAARLRRSGHEPRLVRVTGSELMRVRVGSFPAQAEAVALRNRLRSDGFEAVVVEDGTREFPVP